MSVCPRQAPLFSFGVIADVQYADIDDGHNFLRTRKRYYRTSVLLLRKALKSWSEAAVKPDFVLQLGDIIDGFNRRHEASERALEVVLRELSSSPAEVHHVWGNHEFYNFSRTRLLSSALNSRPDTERSLSESGTDIYAYHFRPHPGFSFIVLDAYDLSLLGREESSEQYKEAMLLLRQHNDNEDLNQPAGVGLQRRFVKFNGAFSKEQLDWLDSLLSLADARGERVTLVCHLPVHPDSTDPNCLVWNFDQLLTIIRSHSSVVCYMSGHDHEGGYHLDQETGVHHVTLEGVIETPPDSNAFGTVSVYDDRMVLKGNGRIPDRVLLFPCRQNNPDHTAE